MAESAQALGRGGGAPTQAAQGRGPAASPALIQVPRALRGHPAAVGVGGRPWEKCLTGRLEAVLLPRCERKPSCPRATRVRAESWPGWVLGRGSVPAFRAVQHELENKQNHPEKLWERPQKEEEKVFFRFGYFHLIQSLTHSVASPVFT